MTTIIGFFKRLTDEAKLDLERLEEISRTIQDFLNYPTKFISNRRKVENRQLKDLFDDIAEKIIMLPSLLERIQVKEKIQR